MNKKNNSDFAKNSLFKVTLLLLFLTLPSCKTKIRDYYSGVVIDESGRPVEGVQIKEDINGNSAVTDENGYFKFKRTENYLPDLILNKEGYLSDTIPTVWSNAGETIEYSPLLTKDSSKITLLPDTIIYPKEKLVISAIDAKFPLRLSEIQFDNKENIVELNDGISTRIQQTINEYYINDCAKENQITYKDIYINTVQLRDSLYTLFVVLLKHYPTNAINSKVLLYNNFRKEFIVETLDFNLNALYDYENEKFIPSNLKRAFKINSPEIELIDENKDGVRDYKYTRLFHNGTFNALHTIILTIKNSQVDTLHTSEKILGMGNENKH